MIKGLVTDSVVFGAANAVQKLVPLFIIPIITGYLGPDALKTYDVSFVYAYIFSWLIILGQDAAASVLFFDQKKTAFDKKQVTAYAVFIQFFCLLIFFCLFFPFSTAWSNILFSKDISFAGWWVKAMLILPGHILLNFSLNLLLWQKRRIDYISLCGVQTLFSIGSVFISVVSLHGNVSSLFYSLIGSTSLAGVVGLIMIRKQVFVSLFPINKALIKKLVILGIPFALTSFFHQLLPAIDRYFLIQFGYSQQMAPYILSVKLGALVSFASSAFVLAFTPYSMAKLNDEDAEKEISILFRFVSAAGFILIPFLLIFKNLLIYLFADASYQSSVNLLPFFFFGWLFDLFSYFSTLGIYRSQKSFFAFALFATGFIVVSLLDLLLIPKFGLYGAAIGFVISKAVLFFVSLAALRKYFYLQLDTLVFWIAFAFAGVSSYFSYILPLWFNIIIFLLLICGLVYYFRKQNFGAYYRKRIPN